jgi:hypothetical protein
VTSDVAIMIIIVIISSIHTSRMRVIMAVIRAMAGTTTARWWPISGAGSGYRFY